MQHETLMQILDLTRWAPSGDNHQPYRFEIISPEHVAIRGFDTSKHVVYDFEGHASHMAHGALLETMRIAASRFNIAMSWQIRDNCADDAPIYDVYFDESELTPSPLANFIESRCVQRRPMALKPLSADQKKALVESVGEDYTLQFFETREDRMKVAKLLWHNAKIRLTCPEAYPVHCDVIEWGARFSKDRIPEGALGVDPITAKLMRLIMKSWQRVEFFNRYLLGTVFPRIQLDLIPAICCSTHILIKPKNKIVDLQDYVEAGVAMQKLWLTTASLGLYLQPEMTPVIFRWYTHAGKKISRLDEINISAEKLTKQFETISSSDSNQPFSFFCRVGFSAPPSSRSIRLDLKDLMYTA